ncbi:MAG TPA: hypothetical protein VLA29_11555 [Acidimicrobiia bacterium]|nr:hypothetical protein [Acidimicrobiia bacterium]
MSMLMSGRQVAGVLAICLFATACDGGTADPTTTEAGASTTSTTLDQAETPATTGTTMTSSSVTSTSPSAADLGSCTITLSGDRDDTWTFTESVYSLTSDYWSSEEELRSTVEFLGEDVAGGSYDELVAAGEPIITFLTIGCLDADDLIRGAKVTHTNASRSSDIPMGPGSYPIDGGLFDADGPAGTMIADFNVSSDELYASGSGSLEITQWDSNVIEGSFSFPASEMFVDDPRVVDVTVTFRYTCQSWHSGC